MPIDVVHDAEDVVVGQHAPVGRLVARRSVERVPRIVSARPKRIVGKAHGELARSNVAQHRGRAVIGRTGSGPRGDLQIPQRLIHALGLVDQRPVGLGHGRVSRRVHPALLGVGNPYHVVGVDGQQRHQAAAPDAVLLPVLVGEGPGQRSVAYLAGGVRLGRRGAEHGLGARAPEAIVARLFAGAQILARLDLHEVLVLGLLRGADLGRRGLHLARLAGARHIRAARRERFADQSTGLDRAEGVLGHSVEQPLEPLDNLPEDSGGLASDVATVRGPRPERLGNGFFFDRVARLVAWERPVGISRAPIVALRPVEISLGAVRALGATGVAHDGLPAIGLGRQHTRYAQGVNGLVVHDPREALDNLIGRHTGRKVLGGKRDDLAQVEAFDRRTIRPGDFGLELHAHTEQWQLPVARLGVEALDNLGQPTGESRRHGRALGRGRARRNGRRGRDVGLGVTRAGIRGRVEPLERLLSIGLIAVRIDHHRPEQVPLLVVAVLHHAPRRVGGRFDGNSRRPVFLADLAYLLARLRSRGKGADRLAVFRHPELGDGHTAGCVFLESAGRQVVGHGLALDAERVVEAVVALAALDQLAAPHHGIADGVDVGGVLETCGLLDGGIGVAPLLAHGVERLAVLLVGERRLLGQRNRHRGRVGGHGVYGGLQRIQLRLRHPLHIALTGGA